MTPGRLAEIIDNESVLKLQLQVHKIFRCFGLKFDMSSEDYDRIVKGGCRYLIKGTTEDVFIDRSAGVPNGVMKVSFNVPLPTIKEEPEDPSKPKRFKLDVDVYNIHNVEDAKRLLLLALSGLTGNGLATVEGIEAQK